ncbi:MAG: trypsin-like peptidase domain-containing protein [Deltaproteobacteria bacterium]|nr:trypsin-like peptidase domain-containing protein [Deltaproteobacteria bacterium]
MPRPPRRSLWRRVPHLLLGLGLLLPVGAAVADELPASPPGGPAPEAVPVAAPAVEPPPEPESAAGPAATADSAGAAEVLPVVPPVERWLDSVVLLVTGPGWCSGAVIDAQGTIATAYHCVSGGQRPRVRLRDGTEHTGRTIAADPREDLALIAVPELAGVVTPLPMRRAPAQRGERVYGLGHPYAPAAQRSAPMDGVLLWSVSEGIISAVGARLVQTDAALNPGNSGGPVVDAEGRMLGVVSRKLGGDNIAFFVPNALLDELPRDKVRLGPLGGQVELGVALTTPFAVDTATSTMGRLGVVLRDHLALHGELRLSSGARGLALEQGLGRGLSAGGGLGLRQGFGRGLTHLSLEAGGGVWALEGWTADFDAEQGTWTVLPTAALVSPGVYGRVAFAGVGLRALFLLDQGLPEGVVLGVELGWPGAVLHF